jgi:hypothetical protein
MSTRYARTPHHIRTARIAVTGVLVVATTALGMVLGNATLPSRAVADNLGATEQDASEVQSDRQLIIESASLRGVVAAQQAAADEERQAVASAPVVAVWTAGWQAQINACRGGVDLSARYGIRAVAEHWQCGGGSFPTSAGALVSFSGLDAGTYRVIGVVAVLNAYVAKASQLPRGYDLLFQTCRNNDSRTTEFVALQRVG